MVCVCECERKNSYNWELGFLLQLSVHTGLVGLGSHQSFLFMYLFVRDYDGRSCKLHILTSENPFNTHKQGDVSLMAVSMMLPDLQALNVKKKSVNC